MPPDWRSTITEIPDSLAPYFQEYDLDLLDRDQDANLIIQRVLEHGTWEEIRWLFSTYGKARICTFLQERGERFLSPVSFTYWRKLLSVHRWQRAPFPTPRSEVWSR